MFPDVDDDGSMRVQASVSSSIRIIRKDKTSTEPPMLQIGVIHALLLTSKLHCFYVRESSLVRPYQILSTHGQELIFYNCVVTIRKIFSIVHSFQYCVVDGQTSNENNLILLGLCANKRNPFSYQCYIYNMEKNTVVKVSPHKVSNVK